MRGPEFPKVPLQAFLQGHGWHILAGSGHCRSLETGQLTRVPGIAWCLNTGKPEVLGSEGPHWLSLELGKQTGCGLVVRTWAHSALGLCPQVEHLKEKLLSQAQEVSRLRSELVRPQCHFEERWWMPSRGSHLAVAGSPCPT